MNLQGVEESTDFVFLEVSLMTPIQKTECIFMILRNVGFMRQRFFTNTTQIRAQQKIENMANSDVSTMSP